MRENPTNGRNDSNLAWDTVLNELRLVHARTERLEFMIEVLANDVVQLRADQLVGHISPAKQPTKNST